MKPTSVVTGATGGLGFEVACGLARAGHRVLVTGRSEAKGTDALARLRAAVPGADAAFELLDVASLASVSAFAERMADPVDVLVNNAAVMGLPKRQLTVDGFEQQIGTNYLGHFALTGRLLPQLKAAPRARVVSLAQLGASGRADRARRSAGRARLRSARRIRRRASWRC